ncbi:SDR family NAD(P)-dependent oxidoreductase [Muricoccus aerilatus]|uniref:SDR family NAD(P)-dependent oxidoreductase n=1 Tax=Muricoccus aerilatus TaxID=452982 RepID=UPI000693F610|nr:SDR family NAD(P)-dependent oxidoreductase [Roseomonas aerilata]
MQHPPSAALVSGATSGIGEAFAHALPPTTNLLLTGRNEEGLARVAAALQEAGPGRRVETIAADLSTDEGLDDVCAAGEAFGIDLLICDAGVGPFGDFLSAAEPDLRQTVQVNAMAPLVMMRRLLPGMLMRAEAEARRAGLIVVSSGLGFLPVPRLATYAATKAFDLSLTEALAAELSSRPVDILALCPTATRSRFAERSGFGHNLPGAQRPAYVARRALAALGRQRTLVLGPLSGSILTVPALVRAAAAQAIQAVMPRG